MKALRTVMVWKLTSVLYMQMETSFPCLNMVIIYDYASDLMDFYTEANDINCEMFCDKS